MRVTTRNARFQQWHALLDNRTKRHRLGEFLVQGVRPITAAVEHGWTVRALLGDDRDAALGLGGRALGLPHAGPGRRRPGGAGTGAAGRARWQGRDRPSWSPSWRSRDDDLGRLPPDSLVVVLDRPTSPGNIGTVARSADAFGAGGLVVTGHAADPYDPRAVRASTGSLFALDRSSAPRRRARCSTGRPAPGTGSSASTRAPDSTCGTPTSPGPLVLVVGNETTGLAAGWREGADASVSIPMRGAASSLNMAAAASIVLHEALRQRTS